MHNPNGYKLGDWIEDIQTGDIYEILELIDGQAGDWVKIGKKIDGRTKSHYGAIFNTSFNISILRPDFRLANVARLLYSK